MAREGDGARVSRAGPGGRRAAAPALCTAYARTTAAAMARRGGGWRAAHRARQGRAVRDCMAASSGAGAGAGGQEVTEDGAGRSSARFRVRTRAFFRNRTSLCGTQCRRPHHAARGLVVAPTARHGRFHLAAPPARLLLLLRHLVLREPHPRPAAGLRHQRTHRGREPGCAPAESATLSYPCPLTRSSQATATRQTAPGSPFSRGWA